MQEDDLHADPEDRRDLMSVGTVPQKPKSKQIIGFMASLLVVIAGAYWYWSPLLTMHYARAAAEARDSDAFNQYIDYPKVRESLKRQFAARMAEVITGVNGQKAGTAGAALGAMLSIALVDRLVDSMVRPELVMATMNEARMQEDPARKPDKPVTGAKPAKPNKVEDSPIKVNWAVERKGVNRVIAFASDATTPASSETQIGFVFDRAGFADWKLTEIRLPSSR